MSLSVNNQDIFIVGYSLRLPQSNNPNEFHENLLNKINMVSRDDQHFSKGPNPVPAYLGKLKQPLDYFDNLFFGIHGKQAEKLDPQLRLLLETSFEALVDAAIFADEIKGSSTGVYTGVCFSDAHNLWMQNNKTITGYEHSGCAATMFANRLSYFYDIHGPSFSMDTACSSSLTALNYAINDLQQGICDSAFVSGASIILRSAITLGFQKLQMLSPDGFCKTFDTHANGYSRADGIITLLLTKRPDFIRYAPHAKILAASSNTCGYHESGISYPNHQRQAELYEEVLKKTNTQPSEIKYIECHGTGTVVGDTEELLGIKQVFGDRNDLALGALKSNMGHAEGASGLASIAKVLLSYENKMLYPQLHLQEKIPLLGNLRTLSEPESWQEPSSVLINGFGFGGSNACIMIDSVPADTHTIKKTWHGLHFINSRTKEGLYQLKRELEKTPQQLSVFKDSRYPWREVIGINDDLQLEPVQTRPLFFVFSGNGSQWKGMGIQLMQASTLFKEVLTQCGNDIPTLLIEGWSGPLQETRLLTALQIALTELLLSFGIKADGYLAHSAGEIAASYASGATTLKETMAIANARGKAAEEMPDGLMISVGLSREEASDYLADAAQVCIACINSPRNVTLSGNRQQIEAIQQRLINEEKFVRALNTQGKPYHSSLIDRDTVKQHLSQAYNNTTERNPTWISAIDDYNPTFFSMDYHLESVTRPVDFLGAMQKIPTNAMIVEIGPHNLLRSLIRDCVPSIQYASLMTKDLNDLDTFKEGIGRLWKLGANLPIIPDKTRPSLAVRATQTAWKRDYFPVPRDDEKKYKHTFILDLHGKDAYLKGHTIDGRPIFPAMGIAYLFWQTYVEYHPDCEVVTLDHLKIFRSIPLIIEQIRLDVLTSANGNYQLLFNEELIAEATLGQKENSMHTSSIVNAQTEESIPAQTSIPKETFYRLCHNKGYHYTNDFQVIDDITVPDDQGYLYAKAQFNHWPSFLDGLLHLILLRESASDILLPTSIRHMELSNNKSDSVTYNSYTKSICCGEILIQGGEFSSLRRATNEQEAILFQKEDFLLLGYNELSTTNEFSCNQEYLNKILSVVRQNSTLNQIKLFEIGTGTGEFLKQVSANLSSRDSIHCTDINENRMINSDILQHLKINHYQFDINQTISAKMKHLIANADVIVASNSFHASTNLEDNLEQFYQLMKPGAFAILVEVTSPLLLPHDSINYTASNITDEREFGLRISIDHWKSLFESTHFKLISYGSDPNELSATFLIRKPIAEHYAVINAPSVFFDEHWASAIKHSTEPTILYSSEPSGVAGFARTLNQEGKRTLSFCAPNIEPYINEVKLCGLVTNIIHENRLATRCYTDTVPFADIATTTNESYHLEFSEHGNLDQFSFVKSRRYQGKLCKVEYAALNFRDVMLASGKINKQSFLGFSKHGSGVGIEFSGYYDNKRIMGIGLDTIANFVNTDFFWEIPDEIELAEAATIPVAYLTVYYCFFERAHINKKQRILIHGGAGAVGQAAIRVAQSVGCEVFTTCQESKRDYLKTLFPQLDDAHIGDSRSTQFEQQVMEQTQGRGVDIILNSLADDKLQASLYCLAQHGTFLEIGKYDLMRNTQIGLRHFLPNTTFCGIDVDQIFTNTSMMKKLSSRILKGLKQGVVKPIDKTLFKWTQIPEAFRFLGSGNHRGKVVLDMNGLRPKRIENRFYTSGAHLIVGGLGGFAMAVSMWLAERGADHLILVSRTGVTTGEQKVFIQQLKMMYTNLKIDISTVDLIHPEHAERYLDTCPPLTGIYNLAMVLNDTFFETMTREKWQETINCKVLITHNLDQLTRKHPIQQFVCFSSIAVHGNPGQSNYAFANNYMENICYERRAANLPAIAIQWGAVANVGFVAKQSPAFHEMIIATLGGLLTIDSCLHYLESCLLKNNIVSLVVQNNTAIKEAMDGDDDLLQKISRILKIDLASIPDDSTLITLGLDSLQASEMQTIISYASNDMIAISELGKMTIGEIKEKFTRKDTLQPSPTDHLQLTEETNQIQSLLKQHGEDLLDQRELIS
jgi:fatty acid synthase